MFQAPYKMFIFGWNVSLNPWTKLVHAHFLFHFLSQWWFDLALNLLLVIFYSLCSVKEQQELLDQCWWEMRRQVIEPYPNQMCRRRALSVGIWAGASWGQTGKARCVCSHRQELRWSHLRKKVTINLTKNDKLIVCEAAEVRTCGQVYLEHLYCCWEHTPALYSDTAEWGIQR